VYHFLFLMLLPHTRSTLFPYTTLFRSGKGIKNWTETQFFLFSVPEEAITGCVYVLARPELGICHSSINIAKGMCFNPWEVAYARSEEHTSELQSRENLVCRLLLEKKKK